MFPGIDGFHWTVGSRRLSVFIFCGGPDDCCDGRLGGVAHDSTTSAPIRRSSYAGSRILRSCPNLSDVADTNLPAE